jgi:hypothetical protein
MCLALNGYAQSYKYRATQCRFLATIYDSKSTAFKHTDDRLEMKISKPIVFITTSQDTIYKGVSTVIGQPYITKDSDGNILNYFQVNDEMLGLGTVVLKDLTRTEKQKFDAEIYFYFPNSERPLVAYSYKLIIVN